MENFRYLVFKGLKDSECILMVLLIKMERYCGKGIGLEDRVVWFLV